METALYIIIGTMALFIIIGIPGLIWGIYDNKRREKQQEIQNSATA